MILLSASIFFFSSLDIPNLAPQKDGLLLCPLANENSFLFNKCVVFLDDSGLVFDCFIRNNARLVLSPHLFLHGVLRQEHRLPKSHAKERYEAFQILLFVLWIIRSQGLLLRFRSWHIQETLLL